MTALLTMQQTGGDFGDPIAYGGIWSDGERIYVLDYGFEEYSELDAAWGKGNRMLHTIHLEDVPDETESWVKWKEVLECCGRDTDKVSTLTPQDRAELIAGHYGWEELDHYPDMATEEDIKRRFLS